MNKQVDILIIGGGLTGATLMLALKGLGYSTLLVESKPFSNNVNSHFDARSLALSPASKHILAMIGVWEIIKNYATEINLIHVSDQHHFGASRIQAEPNNPLGYVVEMQYIQHALHQLLDKNQVLAPGTLKSLDIKNRWATVTTDGSEVLVNAQLIVAADGADSAVRQCCNLPSQTKEYQQHAIVTNVGLTKPHAHRAYERFTPYGPLALLPMQDNRMSLVWALPPADAARKMAIDDADFLKDLQLTFGYRLGKFAKIGTRYTFPLKQVLMPQQTQWPVVFVGNAAHTLHPVAGQGFNLGLRDVATLAQCIVNEGLSADMLNNYQQLRHHDQQIITRLTDGLIQIFTSRIPVLAY